MVDLLSGGLLSKGLSPSSLSHPDEDHIFISASSKYELYPSTEALEHMLVLMMDGSSSSWTDLG